MKNKERLKTIRLSQKEEKKISSLLREHPFMRNFSTLVRAALWEFCEKDGKTEASGTVPSFLWEYDLREGEIYEILKGPQKKRLWLVAKILEHGKWNEIWKYLTLEQIEHDLALLRMNRKTKAHWIYAVERWRRAA